MGSFEEGRNETGHRGEGPKTEGPSEGTVQSWCAQEPRAAWNLGEVRDCSPVLEPPALAYRGAHLIESSRAQTTFWKSVFFYNIYIASFEK